MIEALAEIPGILFTLLIIDKLGRKRSQTLQYFVMAAMFGKTVARKKKVALQLAQCFGFASVVDLLFFTHHGNGVFVYCSSVHCGSLSSAV